MTLFPFKSGVFSHQLPSNYLLKSCHINIDTMGTKYSAHEALGSNHIQIIASASKFLADSSGPFLVSLDSSHGKLLSLLPIFASYLSAQNPEYTKFDS
jgi:hypothetical protein